MKKAERKKQLRERIITFLEGVCAIGIFLSMSAMDSPDVTIPVITMIVSMTGFKGLTLVEERMKKRRCM